MQYGIYRVNDDGSTTLVSQHGGAVEAITQAAWITEHEDHEFAYQVNRNGTRLAILHEGRIGYREWARRSGRLDTIHALDDRYDHDIDELMVR